MNSTNKIVKNALMAWNGKFKVGDIVCAVNLWPYDREKVIKVNPDGTYDTKEELGGKVHKGIKENQIRLAKNSSVAANADSEASIDAEAKKLAKEVLSLASKFDALQKRLTKIGLYYTDYQAAANDLRNVHSFVAS